MNVLARPETKNPHTHWEICGFLVFLGTA